jgi:hypothetical protein
MEKDEVIKHLGGNYVIGYYTEALLETYTFEHIGLTFLFDGNKVDWIAPQLERFAINENMNFEQIENKLGKGKRGEYYMEQAGGNMYTLTYEADNHTIQFTSSSKNGDSPSISCNRKRNATNQITTTTNAPETDSETSRTIDLMDILKKETVFVGNIGNEMQKMGVVFLSTVKKTDVEYEVTGKSKVKDNICDFKGTVEVQSSGEEFFTHEELVWSEGNISGKFLLKEDRNQSSTGEFEGTFYFQWGGNTNTIFDIGERHSAEIEVKFDGNWKSYRTGASRRTSWGNSERVLPGGFNDGQEYIRAKNYRSIGWGSYFDRNDEDEGMREKAEKEYRAEWVEWWK